MLRKVLALSAVLCTLLTPVMLADTNIFNTSGNVGIFTLDPRARLDIGVGMPPRGGYTDLLIGPGGDGVPQLELYSASKSAAISYDGTTLSFFTNGTSWNQAMVVDNGGNVGIGTGSPGFRLDVNGNAHVSGNMTVDGNLAAKYQDVAEWVPASESLTSGTVVVLNRKLSNSVMASVKAYDTTVAGVVSEEPGITLGVQGPDKAKIATTGRVRVKVDASRGPIEIGDLLVTGEKSGTAMKSEPIEIGGVKIHRPGTIIGKALEPLEKGEGEVLVLLSLQ
jgi:hypothetical protein